MLLKPIRIGNILINNNVFLAPMAGITDLPFRLICKEQGCGLVYTEMVSAKGIMYNNSNTAALFNTSPDEKPVAAQIFGSDPYTMSECVKKINHLPFDIVDINMGCPVPKIVRNFEGSALMGEPVLVGKIVEAVSRATDKPVTVKIRKGINGIANAPEIAKIIEDNGGAGLTVHGRTREQYYSGEADWDIIARVKAAVNIPVIGNGDVNSADSAEKMLLETGCDGVMIGRSAQGYPWIFAEIIYYLKNRVPYRTLSVDERVHMALRHASMLLEYKGSYTGISEMRKHLAWYTKGLPGASSIRKEINNAENFEKITELLESFL